MQNEAQYDLDRKAAKMSALSSNNLDKYEYLTTEVLDKNDQKEGLFKRLKNIENAQKILIRDDDNKSIYYTPRSEFDDKDDKYKKTQQNNNIDTKPPNVFNYLKRLSRKAKNVMKEIKDADIDDDDDIDDGKLLFIQSNKEKFNFNTFNKPLNFISAIYNGEISLIEAEN